MHSPIKICTWKEQTIVTTKTDWQQIPFSSETNRQALTSKWISLSLVQKRPISTRIRSVALGKPNFSRPLRSWGSPERTTSSILHKYKILYRNSIFQKCIYFHSQMSDQFLYTFKAWKMATRARYDEWISGFQWKPVSMKLDRKLSLMCYKLSGTNFHQCVSKYTPSIDINE